MSDVTLLDIGPPGRQTILIGGVQVGYFRPATGTVQIGPEHADEGCVAYICEELTALGLLPKPEAAKVINTPEAPPPAVNEDGELEDWGPDA